MIGQSQHWLIMSQIVHITPRNRHCPKVQSVAVGRSAYIVSAMDRYHFYQYRGDLRHCPAPDV